MAFNTREQLANIPVVGRETARLVQALRSWPQSYWSRPTYCPGWTAADSDYIVVGNRVADLDSLNPQP